MPAIHTCPHRHRLQSTLWWRVDQREAERELVVAGLDHMAAHAEQLGARTLFGPPLPVPLAPVFDDVRNGAQGLDVVDR